MLVRKTYSKYYTICTGSGKLRDISKRTSQENLLNFKCDWQKLPTSKATVES